MHHETFSRLTTGILIGALILFSGGASPQTPKVSSSSFGRFNLKLNGDICELEFTAAKAKAKSLFKASDCAYLFKIAPIKAIGTTRLPIVAKGGVEFHLYGIPTARGGNACEGDDLWVVVVDKDGARPSQGFGGCSEIHKVTIDHSQRNTVVRFFSDGEEMVAKKDSFELVKVKSAPKKRKLTN